MSFKIKTPQEIQKKLEAEINSALEGADASLRYSVENILARMLTIVSFEMQGYIEYVSKQILVTTADNEWIDVHARKWGITRKPASVSIGVATFTGTDGTIIPAETIIQRADGIQYQTDADGIIAAGTVDLNITAIEAGANGNADAGALVNLISPIPGINGQGTISTATTAGTDVETDEALRARIHERIQNPPHGGADHDYIGWAKEVPGVTRAWVYPNQLGDGTVSVCFVMDDKDGSIIPDAAEVSLVTDHIDILRPTTSDVTVFAPAEKVINFEMTLNPNNVETQNAVIAEVKDLFRREAEHNGTVHLSRINEAISRASGEFDHQLTSPNADVTAVYGEIPVPGTFTWS